MNERASFEFWTAITLYCWAMNRVFMRLYGMTLDEIDELNYQRIMGSDDRSA